MFKIVAADYIVEDSGVSLQALSENVVCRGDCGCDAAFSKADLTWLALRLGAKEPVSFSGLIPFSPQSMARRWVCCLNSTTSEEAQFVKLWNLTLGAQEI